MNTLAKALFVGFAIEIGAAALFAFGGFGPCGPSNPLGFVGLIANIPGLVAAWPINYMLSLTWTNSIGWLLVAIFQGLFNAAIAYWCLDRPSSRTVRGGDMQSDSRWRGP